MRKSLVLLSILGFGLMLSGCHGGVFTPEGTKLSIGDEYQGGRVAYILQAEDPGYSSTVVHGLIAAMAPENGISWALLSHSDDAAFPDEYLGTAIGTGSANTDLIIAQNGPGTNYAAGLAKAYSGGDYTDWYLPSRDELGKLNLNQAKIGGPISYAFWSSSEYNTETAYAQGFADVASIAQSELKLQDYAVWPIRSF